MMEYFNSQSLKLTIKENKFLYSYFIKNKMQIKYDTCSFNNSVIQRNDGYFFTLSFIEKVFAWKVIIAFIK